MKVLVCDDFEERGQRILERVANIQGDDIDTEGIFGDDLKNEIDRLYDGVRSLIGEESERPKPELDSRTSIGVGVPCADIVILDNDLTALATDGAAITADWIATYVRGFWDVAYVVSLNKNREVDFDLRYLLGDPDSPADLALNEDHLGNVGLWRGCAMGCTDPFLPWYWPALRQVAQDRRAQIEFVKTHFTESILQALSFPRECLEFLSRHAKGRFSSTAYDDGGLYEVTFERFFIDSCTSVSAQQKRKVLAGIASAEAMDVVARIVAAELEKWIRRYVVTPQDVLIDLPHLIARMPFVMGSRSDDIAAWNTCLRATEAPYGLDEEIYTTHLLSAAFASDIWTKSACFWWPLLKSSRELNELFFDKNVQWAAGAFFEDTSSFSTLRKGQGGAKEFVGEFEGSWRRRYVMHLENRNYVPPSQFAK